MLIIDVKCTYVYNAFDLKCNPSQCLPKNYGQDLSETSTSQESACKSILILNLYS